MRGAVLVWLMATIAAIGHPAAQEAQGAAPQRQSRGEEGESDSPATQASADAPQQMLLPEVTRSVPPVYPPMAIDARVQGRVVVGVAIDAEGRIQSASVTQSIPALDQAALDAVRQWQFTPPVVDGKPAPTGINVAIDFVLGITGDAPVPSVPEPRPSWIPADFAFEYAFRCRQGQGTITLQRYTSPGGEVPIQFAVEEIQPIYLRMFAAGAFSVPGRTWMDDRGVRTTDDGFLLRVVAEGSGAGLEVGAHQLDVRHYSAWRRVEWTEPDYERRPELHDQLETIGQLIRETVAQKPEIQALPLDQRACLN